MTPYHVLVVDDEMADVVVTSLTPIAKTHGITFSVASDGEECLRIAEENAPDLILLDMQLPVADGFEILAELKQRRVVTRVIMMSGKVSDLETVIRCVRAGACDYILKENLQPRKLLDRILRSLVLNNTTNMSLSELSPLQQELVDETAQLKREWTELRKENASLKEGSRQLQRRLIVDVVHKAAVVGIAAAGVLLLSRLGIDEKSTLTIVFVVLLIMLLIPIGRLQSISATMARVFTGSIVLQDSGSTRSKDESATTPAAGATISKP